MKKEIITKLSIITIEGKEIRYFFNEENEIYFVGKDIADLLGYKDTSKAIRTHCKNYLKFKIKNKNNFIKEYNFINIEDLKNLYFKSKMSKAKNYKLIIKKIQDLKNEDAENITSEMRCENDTLNPVIENIDNMIYDTNENNPEKMNNLIQQLKEENKKKQERIIELEESNENLLNENKDLSTYVDMKEECIKEITNNNSKLLLILKENNKNEVKEIKDTFSEIIEDNKDYIDYGKVFINSSKNLLTFKQFVELEYFKLGKGGGESIYRVGNFSKEVVYITPKGQIFLFRKLRNYFDLFKI